MCTSAILYGDDHERLTRISWEVHRVRRKWSAFLPYPCHCCLLIFMWSINCHTTQLLCMTRNTNKQGGLSICSDSLIQMINTTITNIFNIFRAKKIFTNFAKKIINNHTSHEEYVCISGPLHSSTPHSATLHSKTGRSLKVAISSTRLRTLMPSTSCLEQEKIKNIKYMSR